MKTDVGTTRGPECGSAMWINAVVICQFNQNKKIIILLLEFFLPSCCLSFFGTPFPFYLPCFFKLFKQRQTSQYFINLNLLLYRTVSLSQNHKNSHSLFRSSVYLHVLQAVAQARSADYMTSSKEREFQKGKKDKSRDFKVTHRAPLSVVFCFVLAVGVLFFSGRTDVQLMDVLTPCEKIMTSYSYLTIVEIFYNQVL